MRVPHMQRAVERIDRQESDLHGYVAWCTCGMGSPVKTTPQAAKDSLAKHTDDPSVFPS